MLDNLPFEISQSLTGDEKHRLEQAVEEQEVEEQEDPLAYQGYGEEDFSGRDYTIPGVDGDDPDPYKWHTGTKRDHGGEDAIEICVAAASDRG